uniref:RCK N-terminal domain-containing protein n=1 Tax=Picocystis salinarum TaxID=88271 RepID=A0A7S3UFH0_9CHLO
MSNLLESLRFDLLLYLSTTVVMVPVCKSLKVSPILGFLLSGFVFSELGIIKDYKDIESLAELGVLFLLFEMGLELTFDRLKTLAKYAFGLGTVQVALSTLAFMSFELPAGNGLGTRILTTVTSAPASLVNIRSVDEAFVIGAALSLSSSAFVLQLLSEKGELPTKVGSATLGILLLQDIAVVPLLVLLPLIDGTGSGDQSVAAVLGVVLLKAVFGLGALSIGGRVVLRRVFEYVADARSPETFVGLCLLTVSLTSILTSSIGFSDTLGAFLAGVLLAETNFRTQIEADIKPFKGLLLGLFFLTTGTAIDLNLLIQRWPTAVVLLAGLIAVKTATVAAFGPLVGLTRKESIRVGFLLSQGGEFAFVLLSLANQLEILPSELNKLLIIVVVLSMTLTPALAEIGNVVADKYDDWASGDGSISSDALQESEPGELALESPVVLCGFGPVGQVLANLLSSPLSASTGQDGGTEQSGVSKYVAFDLNIPRVKNARQKGFVVYFGDGSRPDVLKAAGVLNPRAFVVLHSQREVATRAVESIRAAFPQVSIYARAADLSHSVELEDIGATHTVAQTTEIAISLGAFILEDVGVRTDDVKYVAEATRACILANARALNEGSISLVTIQQPAVEAVQSKDGRNASPQVKPTAVMLDDRPTRSHSDESAVVACPLGSLDELSEEEENGVDLELDDQAVLEIEGEVLEDGQSEDLEESVVAITEQ